MSKSLTPLRIIKATVTLSKKHGYDRVTRRQIASKVGCSCALISYKFDTMDNLKTKVMEYSVANNIMPIIAQGIANQHKAALTAPATIKRQALKTLIK